MSQLCMQDHQFRPLDITLSEALVVATTGTRARFPLHCMSLSVSAGHYVYVLYSVKTNLCKLQVHVLNL